MNTKIPITKPYFDNSEDESVRQVLESGWLVQGPRVAEFEDLFKAFAGTKHALATTSCTTALHLALLAAGIGPDDEVLLPSFTFIATANAVEYTGAKATLIDIDLDTFTIAPKKLEEYLTSRCQTPDSKPRCIIPVSLFGLCADMEAINKIAAKHGIFVIEDAACGLGAERKAHHAGTEALAGVFSFHPRKSITTGEGGMLVTNDDSLAEAVRQMRDHGASKSDLERHLKEGGSLLPEYNMLGFNYRMTDLQGALGVTQMNKARSIICGRQDAAARYNRLLKEIPEIIIPTIPDGYTHAYQSYVCLYKINDAKISSIDNIDWDQIEMWNIERNRLMATLESNGIAVRQGTHAIHTLEYYKSKYKLKDHNYPMSYIADRLSISLPLYFRITEQEQIRVVQTLQTCIRQL